MTVGKLIVVIMLFLSIVLISGCTEKNIVRKIDTGKNLVPQNNIVKSVDNIGSNSGLLKGVSLSPKSSGANDFTGFLEKTKQTGNMLMWAGDWNQLETTGKVVVELAPKYGYTPLIETTFHSNGKLIRPLNNENKEIYKKLTIAFAKKYKPKYLGLGIEVNSVYEKNPKVFEEFVSFYNEVCDSVKVVSSETKIFTVFQLEKMKGLSMWEIEKSKAHWELIDKFKSDIIAFTTYPGLFYKDPLKIPKDHYSEIKLHTKKPIAFTEIGWHSKASPKGWESSEKEQAEFIKLFFNLTKELDTKIAIWSFMYDPNSIEPFDSMGLIKKDETKRLGWSAWVS